MMWLDFALIQSTSVSIAGTSTHARQLWLLLLLFPTSSRAIPLESGNLSRNGLSGSILTESIAPDYLDEGVGPGRLGAVLRNGHPWSMIVA